MTTDNFGTLVQILRDRDIQFDRSSLQKACNDAENGTAIKRWVEEYLKPESLLSKDELAL